MQAKRTLALPKSPSTLTRLSLHMYTTHIKACTGVSSASALYELNYQSTHISEEYIHKVHNLTLELKSNLINIEVAPFPQG